MIFYQLFEKETSTYTYLLGDPESREAVIIDPVIEMVERDIKLIKDLDLKLKYVLETHVHADHVTASGELRARLGAQVGVSSAYDLICPNLSLNDGEELNFGNQKIKIIHTPGHTNGCLSFYTNGMIFTGDALLIRSCGRTDFQAGSSATLYHSIKNKLYHLPDETIIYPAHDYNGQSKSTIGLEKRFNPRISQNVSQEVFIKTMSELKLPDPKKIKESVPANLQCGRIP